MGPPRRPSSTAPLIQPSGPDRTRSRSSWIHRLTSPIWYCCHGDCLTAAAARTQQDFWYWWQSLTYTALPPAQFWLGYGEMGLLHTFWSVGPGFNLSKITFGVLHNLFTTVISFLLSSGVFTYLTDKQTHKQTKLITLSPSASATSQNAFFQYI